MTAPEANMPFVDYARGVVSGEIKAGETGMLSDAEFTRVMGRFCDEAIRCAQCFKIDTVDCPGYRWQDNEITEAGLTAVKVACPVESEFMGVETADMAINLEYYL